MKLWLYEDEKTKYQLEYTVYDCKEITKEIFKKISKWHEYRKDSSRNIKGKAHYNCHSVMYRAYLDIPMGFDIETTSTESGAYMYIWMLSIYDNVIIGRTWEEFVNLLHFMADIIEARPSQSVIVWVHNLSFEFQFIRKILDFSNNSKTFFKEARRILYGKPDNLPFEFKDSLAMTNSSLARLAKDYCKVQKLVGDLDYRIPRNQFTVLTEQEQRYCHNDVLILSQFAVWFWNEYIERYKCPLTCTGALYSEVKDNFKEMHKQKLLNKEVDTMLFNAWPETIEEYHIWMDYLYRGGYVHGAEKCIDVEYDEDDNVYSYDFTSSYPAVMLNEDFPWEFYELDDVTINDLSALATEYAFIIEVEFHDIQRAPWTWHSIESKSKCVELEDYKLDNGRIRSANKMTVWLTELDWLTYTEFYTWDEKTTKILSVKIAGKRKLPKYLIDSVIKYGVAKNTLKHEGKPYALEKSKFNSFYGLCVKKVIESKTLYDGENYHVEETLNWDKERKRILLPQWGIWISAYARRNLLATVHKLDMIHKDVAYCDTDSLKIIGFNDDAKKIIDDYNKVVNEKLRKALEYYEVSEEYKKAISDLGEFDCEGKFDRLKILGAKRYIYSQGDKFVQTIAGLPKDSLIKQFKTIDKCFEEFTDNLNIMESGKLMAKYFDDPTSDIIDGVEMYSETSVSLLPCKFTMKIDGDWRKYLEFLKEFRLEEKLIYE